MFHDILFSVTVKFAVDDNFGQFFKNRTFEMS